MANKTTLPLEKEQIIEILSTIKDGYEIIDTLGRKRKIAPDKIVATALLTEYNTALRISDVLNLTMKDFKKFGNNYRIMISEIKTSKERKFIVSENIYSDLREYADEMDLRASDKLFNTTHLRISRALRRVCSYLGIDEAGVGSHSFRKSCCMEIFNNEEVNKDIMFIKELLQHSSVLTTQRYLAVNSKTIESVLEKRHNTLD